MKTEGWWMGAVAAAGGGEEGGGSSIAAKFTFLQRILQFDSFVKAFGTFTEITIPGHAAAGPPHRAADT